MRFIVDECTGPSVARWLQSQGHDVFSVFDDARGISDDEVLDRAVSDQRILITNDKDFGEKVFRELRTHCGVVFLRLLNEHPTAKIEALEKLLSAHAEELENAFVVVSESHVRFARSAL